MLPKIVALSPPVDQSVANDEGKLAVVSSILLSNIGEFVTLAMGSNNGLVLLYYISMLTTQYYHPIITISATCSS